MRRLVLVVFLAASLVQPAAANAPSLDERVGELELRVAEVERQLDSLDGWMVECVAHAVPVRIGKGGRLVVVRGSRFADAHLLVPSGRLRNPNATCFRGHG